MPELCPHCGLRVDPWFDDRGQRVCPACRNTGNATFEYRPEGIESPLAATSNQAANTPAILSLVLGLVGFCSLGLTAIAGFILGIIGINKAQKLPGRKGAGLALAGLMISIFAILGSLALIGLMILGATYEDENPLPPPSIDFSVRDEQREIVVTFVEDGVNWLDILVEGCFEPFAGEVKVGDVVGGCSGEVDVIWSPTDEVIFSHAFR